LGEGNVCVYVGKITEETLHNASAEECGVDDCEGEEEEKSKTKFNIKDHECNVITEDNIGIIFKLESNDVKVSIRDFGSYDKFKKECFHKGYKCSMVNTYLTAQLFAAPATGQKWHKSKCMNIT
jgi:hypothetical protein